MGKKHFTHIFVDRPWTSILLSLLFLVATAFGATKLYTDFGYRVWFQESNPKLKVFDAFERKFGNDENALIAVHSPSGLFDKTSMNLLKDLTEDLWLSKSAIRVDSITNYNWVHSEEDDILVEPLIPEDLADLTPVLLKEREEVAKNHKVIPDYLMDKGGTTALIYVSLKPSMDEVPDYQAIAFSLKKVVRKYQLLGSDGEQDPVINLNPDVEKAIKRDFSYKKYGGDHTFYLTGSPILTFAFQESSATDMKKIVPFVFLLTMFFLFVLFRRLSGVLTPLVVIFASIIATLGLAGWIGIEINILTAIVPQFLIALSIAVAVHLLASFYQLLGQGIEHKRALKIAIEKNWTPTILTSVSTAIGFLSFVTSGLPPVAKMGIMSGFGTLFAWLVSFTILVPILSLIEFKTQKNVSDTDYDDVFVISPRAERITNFIYKFKYPIIILFLICGGVSAHLASHLKASSDPFEYFQPHNPIRISNEFIETKLGGITGVEMMIHSGLDEGIKAPAFLKKVEGFQNWIESKNEFTSTISIVDILKEMNQVLNDGLKKNYVLPSSKPMTAQQLFLYTMNLPQGMDINNRVSIKNDSIRLTAMTTTHESNAFLTLVEELEREGKKRNLDVEVTGKIPLYQANNEVVVDSFVVSMSLAIVLIAILLIVGLRSVKIGIISIIPNSMPLLIGAGFLHTLGKNLDVGTVIVGSVCLGIAVDDTIHFLSNFKKFLSTSEDGVDVRTALGKVFTYTVPALITTTVVLVVAFSSFLMASFVPNQNFGIMVAFILTVALIADIFFLPALLIVFFDRKKIKKLKRSFIDFLFNVKS
jgi:predicted RND superfamily exporter protein